MIKHKLHIPLYDIDVNLIQIEGSQDLPKILTEMRTVKCDQVFMNELKENIDRGCYNGGETYRNFDLRKLLVLFYPMENEETCAEVYSHEKRHVEDRIMRWASVDDIESAGLLAGFLGREFYKFNTKVQNVIKRKEKK